MTFKERCEMLKSFTGESNDTLVSSYLKLSGDAILNKAYPFGVDVSDVPLRYHILQVEIATYLYNKRGAEGETSHSENGISRNYENGGIPDSMLDCVVPLVKPIG